MGATQKLLALYRVDKQLRGLKGRLRGAEAYLKQQDSQLDAIGADRTALRDQIMHLEAQEQNDENESKGIDERIVTLRERMNNAQTSKEHSALLTEVNTLKADKGLIEERAIETLEKLDGLRAQLGELDSQESERKSVREVAIKDRDQTQAEIKERLDELEAERAKVIVDVPPAALEVYQERLDFGVEDVMAPIEEQSRRNLDYTCGSCFTHLPIEQVSILLKRGDITRCPSCEAILYIEEDLRDDITTANEKKRKRAEAANQS